MLHTFYIWTNFYLVFVNFTGFFIVKYGNINGSLKHTHTQYACLGQHFVCLGTVQVSQQ